jgi:hypothetical protein
MARAAACSRNSDRMRPASAGQTERGYSHFVRGVLALFLRSRRHRRRSPSVRECLPISDIYITTIAKAARSAPIDRTVLIGRRGPGAEYQPDTRRIPSADPAGYVADTPRSDPPRFRRGSRFLAQSIASASPVATAAARGSGRRVRWLLAMDARRWGVKSDVEHDGWLSHVVPGTIG